MTELIDIKRGRSFTVCALSIDGNCQVDDFLNDLERDQPKEYVGIMALIERAAENGPPKNTEKCNPVGDGLFELKHLHTRVLFFYQPGRIILCSHGFWKPNKKKQQEHIKHAKK